METDALRKSGATNIGACASKDLAGSSTRSRNLDMKIVGNGRALHHHTSQRLTFEDFLSAKENNGAGMDG